METLLNIASFICGLIGLTIMLLAIPSGVLLYIFKIGPKLEDKIGSDATAKLFISAMAFLTICFIGCIGFCIADCSIHELG